MRCRFSVEVVIALRGKDRRKGKAITVSSESILLCVGSVAETMSSTEQCSLRRVDNDVIGYHGKRGLTMLLDERKLRSEKGADIQSNTIALASTVLILASTQGLGQKLLTEE